MSTHHILCTDQRQCFDAGGQAVECAGSGQDGEMNIGRDWSEARFEPISAELIRDRVTELIWPRAAASFEFPLNWTEALAHVRDLNADGYLGHTDWRLPNRRELRSLVSHGQSRPALPAGHPFSQVQQTWYWTSTSSAMYPGHAWAVHLLGGRMFYNRKDQVSMVWPVRGHSPFVPRTGQTGCFDARGNPVSCAGSGQDGDLACGVSWPDPRFEVQADGVLDRLTGLIWARSGPGPWGLMTWSQALQMVREHNAGSASTWHLPNINELESLVDASASSPALPPGHPFPNWEEVLWSSTSSGYEPDWAYALYLHKGAVGVGYKKTARFGLWMVRV